MRMDFIGRVTYIVLEKARMYGLIQTLPTAIVSAY